jgi:hypothetical protein
MGSGSSPLSCGVFLSLPLFQAFLLLVAGRVPLLLPFPAGLLWGISPPPSSVLRVPCPLCYMSFLLLLLIIQYLFLFSLGGGRSVQGGAMLIWPSVVCGSTTYRLAHLVVHIFPSCLGAAIWNLRGSPPHPLHLGDKLLFSAILYSFIFSLKPHSKIVCNT